MRVGLVRHLQVKTGLPGKGFITQNELMQWLEKYDMSDIEDGEIDLGNIPWTICFASDLPRAVKTAEKVFKGQIITMKELREVRPTPIFRRNVKLPLSIWYILIRIIFMSSHKSQLEHKIEVQERVADALDKILAHKEQDLLIVSHAALMVYIRKELIKRGFKGPKYKTPDNGRLYIFEK